MFPGIHSVSLNNILPPFVFSACRKPLHNSTKKGRDIFTNEAVVVATESRTSSPVRIPRDHSLAASLLQALYPCGEGSGYAGGIVSAAMDGEKSSPKNN
jgi:uncharacterized FAD-dependent dehydrogenase